MKNKKRVLGLGIVVLIVMSIFVGCDEVATASIPTMSDNLKQSGQQIAQNQSSLEQKQPLPKVDFSNERDNQIRKVTAFNNPNKLGYIYLLSDNGQPISFFVVKGKISNLSSYLTPDQQIVKDPYFDSVRPSGTAQQTSQGLVVQAPDLDGSYGTNGEGIFFFEPDGTYHEWNGKYFYSDKPYKMSVQPLFIQELK
jgi:hypothetical protein